VSEPPAQSRRILPPVYLLLAIILMVALDRIAPVARWVPGWLRWLGLVPLVGGAALAIHAAGLFTKAGTTVRPFEPSTALVTSGAYRFTRNPIYLAMIIFLIGIGLLLSSLTPFLVIPAFALLIDRRFIRVEEAMLRDAFGPAYAEFTSRVRRWL
jgi:protein-S-isoprenylcysteine O-methyltransferase Ste14